MTNYLITGATSFLGKAIIMHLAKNSDNKILIVSRKQIEYCDLIDGIHVRKLSGIDLLQEKDLQDLLRECELFFTGKLNIINCVGYYKGQQPLDQTSIAEARRIFESNFVTVYNTATTLLRYLTSQGGGHFIGFSCKSAKYKYPQMAPFSASKAALDCLMGSLANEYSQFGIVANSFALSTIDTDFERSVKPFGDHKNWLKLEEVAILLEEFIKGNFQLMNGNTIDLFRYSESFFHKSYFERIRK